MVCILTPGPKAVLVLLPTAAAVGRPNPAAPDPESRLLQLPGAAPWRLGVADRPQGGLCWQDR